VRAANVSINNITDDSRFSSPFSRYQRVETAAGKGQDTACIRVSWISMQSSRSRPVSPSPLSLGHVSRVSSLLPVALLVSLSPESILDSSRVARDDATCHVGES